jgi:hypothetical protein
MGDSPAKRINLNALLTWLSGRWLYLTATNVQLNLVMIGCWLSLQPDLKKTESVLTIQAAG